MGYNIASNWNRVICYDDNDNLVDEWAGGDIQISDIQCDNEWIEITGKIDTVFQSELDYGVVIYGDEMLQFNFEHQQFHLKFERKKAIKESIVFEVVCRGVSKKAKISLQDAKKSQRLAQKGFVYLGTNAMLQIRKKEIRIIPNESIIGKIKSAVSSFMLK